ncbi:hypothetical protein HOY80DRAFT_916786 [Tuber brumale]|nr:hypothetical protein HOY80DRAFT_916786 [Tuber brumale]
MGNFCSCSESIREMRIEIRELRNDIARLARDREVPEVRARGGRTTAPGGSSDGSSGAIHGQARVGTRRRWAVGRYRNSEESRAAEEFVARAKRSRNYGRDRT